MIHTNRDFERPFRSRCATFGSRNVHCSTTFSPSLRPHPRSRVRLPFVRSCAHPRDFVFRNAPVFIAKRAAAWYRRRSRRATQRCASDRFSSFVQEKTRSRRRRRDTRLRGFRYGGLRHCRARSGRTPSRSRARACFCGGTRRSRPRSVGVHRSVCFLISFCFFVTLFR